ncbi:MAG: NFACT family protein [Nanoarchaeota archaeon]
MRSLTALDLYFLRKEFIHLIGSRLDKVYQPSNKELILQLHKDGKHILKILIGQAIFLSSEKSAGEQLTFAKFLRKQLKNSKLIDIAQNNFERILELHFSGKDSKILIVELFSKGNIILCDKDYNIIAPFLKQQWKDRSIKAKSKYSYPPLQHSDVITITLPKLKSLLKHSDKDSIVKSLAIDLGLGGVYAEEICFRAKLNKNSKEVNDKHSTAIFSAIKDIRSQDLSPVKSGQDTFPFVLLSKDCIPIDSFSGALDALYSYDPSIENDQKKLLKVIKKQEKYLEQLKEDIEIEREKGNIIYQNYELITNILSTPRNKLEQFHQIKKINAKKQEVELEL